MSDNITLALQRLFDKHRIIFWTDANHELREQYLALELPDIEKIELQNNEYAVKYRILREQPQTKFLLYREGPDPALLDNWLLDVQKASGIFRTDQVGIWLSELGLSHVEFKDLVEQHFEFFKSGKRFESLKQIIQSDDTHATLRLKLMAICTGSDPLFDNILENLLQELASKRDEKINLLAKCQLLPEFWTRLEREFGYRSDEPSIRDFALELFRSSFAMGTNGQPHLKPDALVFLKRWKDSTRFSTSFRTLSDEYASVLNIEAELHKTDYKSVLGLDFFRLIDQKIISDLVKAVADRTIQTPEVITAISRRRDLFWYQEYEHLYETIDSAARFFQALNETDLTVTSLHQGIESYRQSWYRIDQLYRKSIFHARQAQTPSLLQQLIAQVENHYTNNYLLRLNDRWQAVVDRSERWDASPITLQRWFYDRRIFAPYLNKDRKICVVISDALRYEIGDELLSKIRQEDKFDASLDPILAMLPSYTQLGMAALLPNKELSFAADDTATILVNGQSSSGLANREKILQQNSYAKIYAAKADDFTSLGKDDARAIVRDNDLFYLYHNRIDSVGDKLETEERVFEAVEEALDDLVKLVKKLTNANISNILVTADHGFIYQNGVLAESDFASVDVSGREILYRNRRFVLGRGLDESPAFMKRTASQLGLGGDLEIQIPKSINRLRLSGSGMRFVHGGATLQEVVIPVLEISKKRTSDVGQVDVEILRSGSNAITSGQLSVTLYQVDAATEKLQPRRLRAAIYAEDGELLSDSQEITFDRTSENPREREFPVRFILTRKSDAYNGKEVILKLEERFAGTTTYQEYRSLRYTLRRSFTSDF